MSSKIFRPENEPDESDSLTLKDDAGRALECYIESALEEGEFQYLLLMPVDIPVVIIAWEGREDDIEEEEATLLEDELTIKTVFADAKAVLAELDLSLKLTAFTLTASGELPPIEDEAILTLEMEEAGQELEPEELQFLASFYHEKQRYSIYTPLAPMLFLAQANDEDEIQLVHPNNEELKVILEELLFEESD